MPSRLNPIRILVLLLAPVAAAGTSHPVGEPAEDRDLATRIENHEGRLATEIAVWEMSHPDLKATHTFGDDKKIRPTTRKVTIALDRGGFTYTFPAHSLTILRMALVN